MDTHAPPTDALEARNAKALALLAKSCLTPAEKVRVMARFLGTGKVLPLPPVFTTPKREPHTYRDLAAWMERVTRARLRVIATRIRRTFTRSRSARRQTRRAAVRVTRGSPAGTSSGSSDDDPPAGLLRVASGTWRWARIIGTVLAAWLAEAP